MTTRWHGADTACRPLTPAPTTVTTLGDPVHTRTAALLTAATIACLSAACGGDPVDLGSARSIAGALGCQHFEDRAQDNGYPDLIDQYTRCDLNGHRVFVLTFKHPGDGQKIADSQGSIAGALNRSVVGDRWEVDDPQGDDAELAHIRDTIDPDAQINGG